MSLSPENLRLYIANGGNPQSNGEGRLELQFDKLDALLNAAREQSRVSSPQPAGDGDRREAIKAAIVAWDELFVDQRDDRSINRLVMALEPLVEERVGAIYQIIADLEGVYDDDAMDPGIRNFCGLRAERLRTALASPAPRGGEGLRQAVAAALDEAWSDYCADAQAFPSEFTITRGPKLWFKAGGNWTDMVADALAAAPVSPGVEVDREAVEDVRIGVDMICRIITRWRTHDEAARAKEGLGVTDDTHIVSPPTWPSHGQLKVWAETLAKADTILERLPVLGGGMGSFRAEDQPCTPGIEPEQWRDIAEYNSCSPVLVGRPWTERLAYPVCAAFRDVVGEWRIFRSEGGMERLDYHPTHWRPLPPPPIQPEQASERGEGVAS